MKVPQFSGAATNMSGPESFFQMDRKKKENYTCSQGNRTKRIFWIFQEALGGLHLFMAKWQRDQLDKLLGHLPVNHVICMHDYSEGYSCRQQDEV